jgi:hypothetical protein
MSEPVISDPQLVPRQKLINEVLRLLGGGSMVDLELDPEDFDLAFNVALDVYRQRSGNAMEEGFVFLDVQPDVNQYQLDSSIQEVREISRRTIGGTAGGTAIDPFSLAFTNNIYMIQNPGALGSTGSGILATYDFAMQFQMLAGRMFGMFVNYQYDSALHILTIHRKFSAVETVALHVYTTRPENVLLADPYARPWLRSYTIAMCKQMLGEARSMFSTIAGPQGGFTMNGEAMKTEAKEMIADLETQLKEFLDQHTGMPFCIG